MPPDAAKGHKNLKSPEDHLISLRGTRCNLKTSSNESYNYSCSPKEKRSRLATWKYKKFHTFSSQKGQLESQLDFGKGEVARARHTSGVINLETGKLKKCPSVLFRFWSSVTSKQASEVNGTRGQPQTSDIPITADQQASAHPPQVLLTETGRVQKGGQQVPRQDRLQGMRPGGTVVGNVPGCNIVTSSRLEANMVGNTGKIFDHRIKQGEIPVAGSCIHSLISVLSTR